MRTTQQLNLQFYRSTKQTYHGCFTTTTSMIIFVCVLLPLLIQTQQYVGVTGQVTDPSTVQVGDTVCFEGFVMDYFCIERGTLLDNPRVSTLVGPDQHSVHCLVDIEVCNTSPYELLADPVISNETMSNNGNSDTPLYTRAYRVDDAGRSMLIELARSHGSCSTCTGSSESDSTPIVNKGFRAEVYGTVTALSTTGSDSDGFIPVQLEVTDVKRSNNQATVCGLARVTPAPAPADSGDDSNQRSGDSGIKVLSALVVLMAAGLAIISLYFGIVSSPNADK